MKHILHSTLIAFTTFLLLNVHVTSTAQSLYFPPISGATWDTLSPLALGWCPDKIDTLTQYLQDKNTKGFIVLKDGKIVIERYFGTFTQDSIWYWASAGKSLSAFLIGIAQEAGALSIDDTVSSWLGTGWTSCSTTDEEKITIRNQLTMTSGFDDGVSDPDCTDDTCLVCIDTAGVRWAYHNAPYHLIHNVLEAATSNTLNLFTLGELTFQTGITGLWVNHVFYSTPRVMARFGLLTLAKGIWAGDTLLHDMVYYNQMINTSQPMNEAYGYLWWLNGKSSFMVPGLQIVWPGYLIPDAPPDMYAALGKNDQKIYVVPSQNLVVVRMGENSGTVPVLAVSSFDNILWQKLNDVFCVTQGVDDIADNALLDIHPNPASGPFTVNIPEGYKGATLRVTDITGRQVYTQQAHDNRITVPRLASGMYSVRLGAFDHHPALHARMVIHTY